MRGVSSVKYLLQDIKIILCRSKNFFRSSDQTSKRGEKCTGPKKCSFEVKIAPKRAL